MNNTSENYHMDMFNMIFKINGLNHLSERSQINNHPIYIELENLNKEIKHFKKDMNKIIHNTNIIFNNIK